jgi:Family of unknown function (DUF6356)
MYEVFLKHPHSIGETYVEHMTAAAQFGAVMIAAGIACIIHAIVPALYPRTASNAVAALYAQMTRRRPRPLEIDYAI